MASRSRPRSADPDNPGRSVTRPPRGLGEEATTERGKVDGEAAYHQVPGQSGQVRANFDPLTDPLPPDYPEEGEMAALRTNPHSVESPEGLEREALRLWKMGNHRQAMAEIAAARDRATGKRKAELRKVGDKMALLIEWEQGFENRERKAQLLATRAVLDAELAKLE